MPQLWKEDCMAEQAEQRDAVWNKTWCDKSTILYPGAIF